MSHLIAAIDESLRPGAYLMCATVASTADRAYLRGALRGLLLPNQRRLHAKTESEGRRGTILKAMNAMPGVVCHIAIAGEGPMGRPEALRLLVLHLLKLHVTEIVLEQTDPGTRRRDRDTMRPLVHSTDEVTWRHENPEHESLLWVSDAVLSAYGSGGEWRRAVEPLVSAVLKTG